MAKATSKPKKKPAAAGQKHLPGTEPSGYDKHIHALVAKHERIKSEWQAKGKELLQAKEQLDAALTAKGLTTYDVDGHHAKLVDKGRKVECSIDETDEPSVGGDA